MAITAAGESFGDLLRSQRIKAGLSREALAERAGISMEAVRAYERKLVRSPRQDTLALLINGLQLSGDERKEFENSALRKAGATPPPTGAPGNNLPWQPTSFIGRQREIEEISYLLAPRRLVTIIGSGGIGKTRTSLELASRIAAPRDGAWFIDLAPISDGSFVVNKLASVLGISLPEHTDPLPALIAAVKTCELLVILDNCEHLLSTVRDVTAAILESCQRITLLATSRERLSLAGERVYRLATLSVPNKGFDAKVDARTFAALELFAERASEHDFSISDQDLVIAADICRRLDGIALAIELAAARLPILGLSELRAQINEHFKVISGSRHDLAMRQRAMNATISWSHDLLDDRERALFRRLAIFSSGWSLESAASVCSDDMLGETAVFDTLFSLVEKSLVQVDLNATPARYSFYESTRAYALDQLEGSGESAWLSRRHAQWIGVFAERIYNIYGGVPRGRWAFDAAPEVDNTLAALEWAFGPEGDNFLACQITGALQGFWRTAGLAAFGRRYVSAALACINADDYPAIAARLLIAQIRYIHGNEQLNSMLRATALIQDKDDPLLLARCHAMLSNALGETGRYADAVATNASALALLRDVGMQRSGLYSNLLSDRSQLLLMDGLVDEARAAQAEALSLAIALADDWSISLCQGSLADIEFSAGNIQRAQILAAEAIVSARRLRFTHIEGALLNTIARCQIVLGQLEGAGITAREALDLALNNSDVPSTHFAIQYLATVAAIRGQCTSGARLLGFVDAWCQRVAYHRSPSAQKVYSILVESLERQLQGEEIAALAAQGALLAENVAIDEALSVKTGKDAALGERRLQVPLRGRVKRTHTRCGKRTQ